jgi:hypothetical protein
MSKTLTEKYGLTEEMIKMALKEGDLSTGVVNKDKIIRSYKNKIQSGLSMAEAVKSISDEMDMTISYIYKRIR